MKKLGLLFAGLLAVLSLSVAGAVKFTDVPPGHWAEEAVYKLADQGIILGFPDGTFRGNEYLTRYQAALLIYRLLERLRSEMKAGVDQETLTALRNALQELAAEVASLGVRVSALEDNAVTKADLEKALAGAGKGGMDMGAVKELKAQVEALAADLAALKTKVDANADSVKALNELAVLLNQDVLSLQDRVATLEKMMTGAPKGKGTPATGADLKALTEYVQALSGDVASLAGKVKGLEGDVSTLKRNAFTISGSLGLTYKAIDASGFAGYDIDRFIDGSAFSAGDTDSPKNGQSVDDAEGLSSTPGDTSVSLSVKFQTAKLTGTSDGEGVNTYDELFQFSLKASAWSSISSGGSATNLNLWIDAVSTTLTVAKGQQLELSFGQSPKAKFTSYVFDNHVTSYGPGIVATLKGLPLGATFTGVYGNNNPSGYDYFYGGHLALSPMKNFSIGASYVAQDSFANPVWGIDADLGLGPISLMGEYFSDATGATSYYAKVKTGFGAFSLGASYRSIAASVTPANMAANDLFTSKSDAPFAADQQGFGVDLGATFGLIGLSAEYQAYDLPIGTPHTYMKGGISLGTDKTDDNDKRLATGLKGFYLSAYYADVDSGACGVAGWKPGQTLDSGYNATLKHFADAPDALIGGLGFTVAYNGGNCTNDLAIYGQYDAKFGPISATLIGRYYNDMLASTTTTKYGVKVETEALAMPFKPSLMGGYVTRSTTGGLAETKWFAGVKFAEFLFAPHSTFKAQYGSYSSTGLSLTPAGTDKDKAFDPASDYLYTTTAGAGGSLTGFELSWTYWDLTASFGSYVDNAGNYADAFKIAYTVNF